MRMSSVAATLAVGLIAGTWIGAVLAAQEKVAIPAEGMSSIRRSPSLSAVIERSTGPKRNVELSGVMWYASWDEAKKRAGETGKPLVLLQLLGRLDEEFC